MSDTAAALERMETLRDAGRYGDLLSMLRQSLAEAEQEIAPDSRRFFLAMFEWKMLAGHYEPARTALEEVRNEQAARLFAGELYIGRDDTSRHAETWQRADRFLLIVEINEILADGASTHGLFARLDKEQSALARRYAWFALPAIVEQEDFALADRYRQDPLKELAAVNQAATVWPLFASPAQPRMSAELSSLAENVRIGIAVLRGLGRAAEADALREALLAGLDSAQMRVWAERELEEPGAIRRAFVAHQMALKEGVFK